MCLTQVIRLKNCSTSFKGWHSWKRDIDTLAELNAILSDADIKTEDLQSAFATLLEEMHLYLLIHLRRFTILQFLTWVQDANNGGQRNIGTRQFSTSIYN